MHLCLYLYKVLPVEFSLVLTPPPGDVAYLTRELIEIVSSVKELLPQFSQALDHLYNSGNHQDPNLTDADEVCLKYSETITQKLDRGRFIERELTRYNPRFKSKILEQLQMFQYLNSRW